MTASITTTASINNNEVIDLTICIGAITSCNDSLKALITNNSKGITIGKPSTAIKAALFPALDAIAETIVNALARPIHPRMKDG